MNKILKCEACGSKLEKDENNQLFCPQCGNLYSDKPDINNNYITNNNHVVKNFYGNSGVSENDRDKIEGYFIRAIDDFKSQNYSQSKDFVVRILVKEPENEDAIVFKKIIEYHKGKNGRYEIKNFKEDNLLSIIKEFITNKKYNNSKHIEEIFDIALQEIHKGKLEWYQISKEDEQLIEKLEEVILLIDDENNDNLVELRKVIQNKINILNDRIRELEKTYETHKQEEKQEAVLQKQENKKKAIHIFVSVLIMVLTISIYPILLATTSVDKTITGFVFFFIVFFEAIIAFRKRS